VGMLH